MADVGRCRGAEEGRESQLFDEAMTEGLENEGDSLRKKWVCGQNYEKVVCACYRLFSAFHTED